MLRSKDLLITALLALLLSACAQPGPLGTPDFEPKLRQDIPNIEGQLIYQGRGDYYYGVDGYDLLSRLAYGKDMTRGGVVVLTDRKLYFAVWSLGKYERRWELDYRTVTSAEVRSLGLGRRLVIKFDQEPKVASLDISDDSGQFIDHQRTVTVCRLIAQHSGKECTLPAQ